MRTRTSSTRGWDRVADSIPPPPPALPPPREDPPRPTLRHREPLEPRTRPRPKRQPPAFSFGRGCGGRAPRRPQVRPRPPSPPRRARASRVPGPGEDPRRIRGRARAAPRGRRGGHRLLRPPCGPSRPPLGARLCDRPNGGHARGTPLARPDRGREPRGRPLDGGPDPPPGPERRRRVPRVRPPRTRRTGDPPGA